MGSGARFGFGRELNTQLVQQTECIPTDNGFEYLAVGYFVDGDAADGNFFVCRRNAEELALVSAGDGPGDDHFVLFADGIVYDEAKIGKGSYKTVDLALVSFGTDGGTSDGGIAESVTFGDDLFDYVQFAIVPDLLIKAAKDILVGVSDGHK
jgi:hypothetical protein